MVLYKSKIKGIYHINDDKYSRCVSFSIIDQVPPSHIQYMWISIKLLANAKIGQQNIMSQNVKITGCSLNIVFFSKILKFSRLWPFSVFPRCQCVYTHKAGRKPAPKRNWQSSEKSKILKEKHNI